MREGNGDERPPIWIGHVSMATPCVAESQRFMLKLGLRPIAGGDESQSSPPESPSRAVSSLSITARQILAR